MNIMWSGSHLNIKGGVGEMGRRGARSPTHPHYSPPRMRGGGENKVQNKKIAIPHQDKKHQCCCSTHDKQTNTHVYTDVYIQRPSSSPHISSTTTSHQQPKSTNDNLAVQNDNPIYRSPSAPNVYRNVNQNHHQQNRDQQSQTQALRKNQQQIASNKSKEIWISNHSCNDAGISKVQKCVPTKSDQPLTGSKENVALLTPPHTFFFKETSV